MEVPVDVTVCTTPIVTVTAPVTQAYITWHTCNDNGGR